MKVTNKDVKNSLEIFSFRGHGRQIPFRQSCSTIYIDQYYYNIYGIFIHDIS